MADEKAQLIELMNPWLDQYWRITSPSTRRVSDVTDRLADAIISAGWRPPPEVVLPSRIALDRAIDEMYESMKALKNWLDAQGLDKDPPPPGK